MKHLFSLIALLSSFSLQALTIGTYNIRNFDYDQRYRIHTNKPALSNILRSLKADVLSVEEINNVPEFERFIARELPGYGVAVSKCGGAHGQRLGFIFNKQSVELLSFNEDLSTSGEEPGCNIGSRPLAIGLFQIKANRQKFFGFTAHLKSGGDPTAVVKRHKQFATLKSLINDLRSRSGVKDFYLAGDLNTTEYIRRGPDFNVLNKFNKDLALTNLTENLGCSAYWWGGSDDGIEEPSLLDHVLATKGLIGKGFSSKIHGHCRQASCQRMAEKALGVSYAQVSDHCPLTSVIQ